jgi:hypothetical protein
MSDHLQDLMHVSARSCVTLRVVPATLGAPPRAPGPRPLRKKIMTVAAGRPRLLSGIAAIGTLHRGNYIGALSVWAEEQDSYDNYFMIACTPSPSPENVKADDLR